VNEALYDKILVAVLRNRGLDREPTSMNYVTHMKIRLPDYYAPSAIVCMDKLPATPNGKIECGKACPPTSGPWISENQGEFVPPRDYDLKHVSLARIGTRRLSDLKGLIVVW